MTGNSDSRVRNAPLEPERAGPAIEQHQVQPLDVTGVRTTAIGTFMWAVAFCVLLVFRGSLEAQGRTWWLWTCGAGFVIGVIAVEHCRRRRDRLARQPAREAETSPLGAAGL